MPNRNELQLELHNMRQNGLAALLAGAAKVAHIDVAFLYAIASRETNCVNELGDQDDAGEYHGVGIVQIDVQHEIAREARDSGTWRTNPAPLVEYGAAMLADNLARARAAFPAYTDDQIAKIAANGYNDGIGTAIGHARDGDSDVGSTGDDYGSDVVARMHVFADLLAGA